MEDARDTLAVNDYEVVILDINLPDGEGTEVLRDAAPAAASRRRC